jgi:hypothetical protein
MMRGVGSRCSRMLSLIAWRAGHDHYAGLTSSGKHDKKETESKKLLGHDDSHHEKLLGYSFVCSNSHHSKPRTERNLELEKLSDAEDLRLQQILGHDPPEVRHELSAVLQQGFEIRMLANNLHLRRYVLHH